MIESEVIALVRQVIRQELAPIVMGLMVSNETESRSTVQRFPNESPRKNIRTVMPFGVASKAPKGTQAFIVPAGNDPSNQNVIGHFDEGRRPPLGEGESCLYDAYGHVIHLSQSKIQIGSNASAENLVLGQKLTSLLSQVLDLLGNHTHPGIGTPPSNAGDFLSLKASPVDDMGLLSQVSFTE